MPLITCLSMTSVHISRGDPELIPNRRRSRGFVPRKRVRESWGMSLLFLPRLRVPLKMPRVARVTTVEVAPRRSGRVRTLVNYANNVAAEKYDEPMDPAAESPLTDLESDGSTQPLQKKKRRRKVKVTEPVVYDIPPVEKRTTSFKGTNKL